MIINHPCFNQSTFALSFLLAVLKSPGAAQTCILRGLQQVQLVVKQAAPMWTHHPPLFQLAKNGTLDTQNPKLLPKISDRLLTTIHWVPLQFLPNQRVVARKVPMQQSMRSRPTFKCQKWDFGCLKPKRETTFSCQHYPKITVS